jgi:hypothetical protein
VNKTFANFVLRMILLILILSPAAYANIPPQQEGAQVYLVVTLFALFLLYLVYPKTKVVTAVLFFSISFISFALPELILLLLAAMIYFAIYSLVKMIVIMVKEKKTEYQYLLGIAISCLCFLGYLISLSSTSVYHYHQNHEKLVKQMQEVSKNIEESREKDPARLYSEKDKLVMDEVVLYGTGEGEKGNLISYLPSADRKSYKLVFTGDYFTRSLWFNLPPGYPQYDSARGFNLGKRNYPLFVMVKKGRIFE